MSQYTKICWLNWCLSCIQKSSCFLFMSLETQTQSKPLTLENRLLSLLLFSFRPLKDGLSVSLLSLSASLFQPQIIKGGCRPVTAYSVVGGGEEEGPKQNGVAGKGRLSLSRKTCALLPKFSFCKPRAVNNIDHWLSMRGFMEIHARAWTLTGNFLFIFAIAFCIFEF